MTTYRLLRDNKQSGPFTEEEMIAKGFKPYDLLWVEGKSAGWQYASEISAFKSYAPVVEEQPYDRFYKKQPAQKTASSFSDDRMAKAMQEAARAIAPERKPTLPQPEHQFNLEQLAGKHIHVALPSGNSVNLTQIVAKADAAPSAPVNSTATAAMPTPVSQAAALTRTADTGSRPKEEPATRVAPVNKTDIPVYNTSVEAAVAPAAGSPVSPPSAATNTYYTGQPAGNSFSWTMILGAVVGIATLVGLGIMIGLGMNKPKEEALQQVVVQHKHIPAAEQVQQQAPPLVRTNDAPANTSGNSDPKPAPVHKDIAPAPNAVAKNTPAASGAANDNKKTVNTTDPAGSTTSSITTAAVREQKPASSVEQAVQHSNRAVETNAELETKIILTENKFKTGTFGGISNLKFTMYNGSKLPLESVEVEVEYIQSNNKVFKTEKLLFKDIAAGGQSTLDAPSSSRGVKINSRVVKVNPVQNSTVRS